MRTGTLPLLGSIIVVVLGTGACRTEAPPLGSSSTTQTTEATYTPGASSIVLAPTHDEQRRPPGGCSTLRTAEDADILRIVPHSTEGSPATVLYMNEQVGLAIVDVTTPDEPHLVASSQFHGTPIGVFERERGAIVVYAPWDTTPPETVIRAVHTKGRDAGRIISELILPGEPRDARGVGDAVIVTRDLPSPSTATAVTSFLFNETSAELAIADEVILDGGGAVMGGSPWGVAIAREARAAVAGPDRSHVTWLDVDEATSAFVRRGTQTVSGVVQRWRRATDHVIDVAEDARVRLVACATAACPAGGAAAYSEIDFANADLPRLRGSSTLARSAAATFRFLPDAMLVARPPADEKSETTEVALFRTGRELVPQGAVYVRGTVGSIALRTEQPSAIAVGWTGTATTGRHAILHDIDIKKAPRLRGSVSFGGDWTWSPAYDDDRAVTFDPRTMLAALPMTTLRGSDGVSHATQVFELGPFRPRTMGEHFAEADRVLFIDGRLLAFSADGVSIVQLTSGDHVERTWKNDLRGLIQ